MEVLPIILVSVLVAVAAWLARSRFELENTLSLVRCERDDALDECNRWAITAAERGASLAAAKRTIDNQRQQIERQAATLEAANARNCRQS